MQQVKFFLIKNKEWYMEYNCDEYKEIHIIYTPESDKIVREEFS